MVSDPHTPYARSQMLTPGTIIELFDVDLTPTGAASIYHFTPGVIGSKKPSWRGTVYEPLPITASGFEKNGRGEQPTPTLSMPATQLIIASVIALDDLRRAKVTRWRVYMDNLDQGSNPEFTYFPPDIYMIQQKVRHNTSTNIIEWQLSTGLDLWGDQVPRRVATQRTCLWRYRVFDGGAFRYENATCPFAGNTFFNEDNVQVFDPRQDKCSKDLEGCELRFGSTSPLPFGGFVGIGVTR